MRLRFKSKPVVVLAGLAVSERHSDPLTMYLLPSYRLPMRSCRFCPVHRRCCQDVSKGAPELPTELPQATTVASVLPGVTNPQRLMPVVRAGHSSSDASSPAHLTSEMITGRFPVSTCT